MKITITLEDPDGFHESIRNAVRKEVSEIKGLKNDEIETIEGTRIESVTEDLGKWIECGEYVRVQFDTEEGTATVLRA